MNRNSSFKCSPNTESVQSFENLYVRAKTAGWLIKALEQKVELESSFFDCLKWVVGGLRPLIRLINEAAKKAKSKPGIVAARQATLEASKGTQDRLDFEIERLIGDHPCLTEIITNVIHCECFKIQQLGKDYDTPFLMARKRLKQTFGLDKHSLEICEFTYINTTFTAVESYLDRYLDIYRYENRSLLSQLLGIKPAQVQNSISELTKSGLIKSNNSESISLNDFMLPFWDSNYDGVHESFSRSLSGKALPLDAYHLPSEDAAHVKKLLEQDSDTPVHILLYGSPGTGKSSFAHSLAKACGVKAWAVTSRDDDDDDDRRASLTACLNLAQKHKRAFILVDEAERLLDTENFFSRRTKDKAWLNSFLEKKGPHIVWITNQVDHIDPAVRRRFSFSIHFKNLGIKERIDIWQQTLIQHRVAKHLTNEDITMLAKKYPVEVAIIHNAVCQAKRLYPKKRHFLEALERIITSQITLQNNGVEKKNKIEAVSDFTLDGVCMEESPKELVERSSRVDAAMRNNPSIRPGSATMLFYGPPGTGKTALARFIAKHLDRECKVIRASDLLSPYVGEAEQNVARVFRKAEQEGEVLIIDEADTFLYSRESSKKTWENSLVNEFLTALEECRCFCICTTNMLTSLDAAAMRRFSHKVPFTYAKKEQVDSLYTKLLAPLCKEALTPLLHERLHKMPSLTPGDFHVVQAQYDSLFVDASSVTHQTLIDSLFKEQTMKSMRNAQRIGFGR